MKSIVHRLVLSFYLTCVRARHHLCTKILRLRIKNHYKKVKTLQLKLNGHCMLRGSFVSLLESICSTSSEDSPLCSLTYPISELTYVHRIVLGPILRFLLYVRLKPSRRTNSAYVFCLGFHWPYLLFKTMSFERFLEVSNTLASNNTK